MRFLLLEEKKVQIETLTLIWPINMLGNKSLAWETSGACSLGWLAHGTPCIWHSGAGRLLCQLVTKPKKNSNRFTKSSSLFHLSGFML